jgi:hypothetical protein
MTIEFTTEQLRGIVVRLAADYGLVVDTFTEQTLPTTTPDVLVYNTNPQAYNGVVVEVAALNRKVFVTSATSLADLGSLFHSVNQHKRSLAKLEWAADRIDDPET